MSADTASAALAKEWAADDGLWTTQETVEMSLRLFARALLASLSAPAAPEEEK